MAPPRRKKGSLSLFADGGSLRILDAAIRVASRSRIEINCPLEVTDGLSPRYWSHAEMERFHSNNKTSNGHLFAAFIRTHVALFARAFTHSTRNIISFCNSERDFHRAGNASGCRSSFLDNFRIRIFIRFCSIVKVSKAVLFGKFENRLERLCVAARKATRGSSRFESLETGQCASSGKNFRSSDDDYGTITGNSRSSGVITRRIAGRKTDARFKRKLSIAIRRPVEDRNEASSVGWLFFFRAVEISRVEVRFPFS